MQDRYVGDIGDFAKFGLLRGLTSGSLHLTLGVMWYAVLDEVHNNDGRHIHYLSPSEANHRRYRCCDPRLYDALGALITSGERRLSAIPKCGILPSSTLYYENILSFADMRRPERTAARQAWLEEGLHALRKADVIFCDPDNGLETTVDRYADKGPKFTYYDDLLPMVRSGKSLILYQHACRQGSFDDQLRMRLASLKARLAPELTHFAVVRFRRVSARAFIIAQSDRHADALTQRLNDFLRSPWGRHFDLIG